MENKGMYVLYWFITTFIGLFVGNLFAEDYFELYEFFALFTFYGGIVFWVRRYNKKKREYLAEQEEKQYYFNQEVIKEKAKIQATIEAEQKAKLENKLKLEEIELKKTNIDTIKNQLEKAKKDLEEVYNTEIYQLGVQQMERKKMTANLKKFILERDDYTCQVCGASLHNDFNLKLEVDHIIPISKGGKTDPSNLQTLCRKCNRSKGAKPMEVFVGGK